MTLCVVMVIAALVVLALLAAFSTLIGRYVEALVPPDGEFMDIDGVRLHYRDIGSGPSIVMIHGLVGQMRNFSYALTDCLADRFRIILIDRPGSGYSTASHATSGRLVTQAALIAGVIDRLGLEHPLVVGHSLGGAVALTLALDHPEAVGALALIAPLTSPELEVPRAFRTLLLGPVWIRGLVVRTLAVPAMILGGKRSRALIFAPETPPNGFATGGGSFLALRSSALAAAAAEIEHVRDDLPAIAERYQQLRKPVGILFGREDAILDPIIHGQAFADAYPFASLVLCDGGHMLPATKPRLVAAWIEDVDRGKLGRAASGFGIRSEFRGGK
jgi:pimeloyl-ACP methyl ester carboxylesterase